MPFTPYHFGPGLALHSVSPRHVSFLSFAAANVAIDLEALYYMLSGDLPVHRFFHTYAGATVAWLATASLLFAGGRITSSLWSKVAWARRELSAGAVAIGAALGAYSHILLDSVVNPDMRPFWPLGDANALLWLASPRAVESFCLACGALGLAALTARKLLTGRESIPEVPVSQCKSRSTCNDLSEWRG